MSDDVADWIRRRATNALTSVPMDDRRDTYAVSFWVEDFEDDPRRPTLRVGTNTERQVLAAIEKASSAAEARWNFAFWRQNELGIIGGPRDPAGERVSPNRSGPQVCRSPTTTTRRKPTASVAT